FLAQFLVGGRLVLGAQPWGASGDGAVFFVEAFAGGEQTPGHAEMDLRAGDAAAQEVVEADGADSGTQGGLLGVRRCFPASGRAHGERDAVGFQGCGQSGTPVTGSAVGGNRNSAYL